MLRLGAFAWIVLTLAGSAAGQACTSTLTLSGSIHPGATISATVVGAPSNQETVLVVSEHQGSTLLHFGALGSLTLALEEPFVLVPLGTNSATGTNHLTLTVPANAPVGSLPSHDLFIQAVTVHLAAGPPHPSLHFCVSNVAVLHVSGGP